MRCCRHDGSGHSALAEPKLLNDMIERTPPAKRGRPKIYLRGAIGLCACSHVNEMH